MDPTDTPASTTEQDKKKPVRDPLFRVEVLAQTPNPQQVVYTDMHTCYSEHFVFDELDWDLIEGIRTPFKGQYLSNREKEKVCGERVVKHLLAGHKGHYGPGENPQITFNVGFFPHSTMQQLRTHRVGVHFSAQSFRYTGQRIAALATMPAGKELTEETEKVFYLRPVGKYTDRQGKKYEYTEQMRAEDLEYCVNSAKHYAKRFEQGLSEEHARGLIPFDVRQHWVMSANIRSLMHILALRGKKDAQEEIRQMCELILPHFAAWCPELYDWFMENQWLKGRLAP